VALLKCPKCPNSIELGGSFVYLEPVIVYRPIRLEEGEMIVEYSTDMEEDETRKAKLRCLGCDNEFRVPKSFWNSADWG